MCLAIAYLVAPLLALAFSASALANPPGGALRLYAAGDYLAAAARAETQATSSSHIMAARALVAAAMTEPRDNDVEDWLNRAERHARSALQLDQGSVDARLQLAFIYGAKARRTSLPQAIAHNYAPRGRRLIQEALARDPDNAMAHALLGAWHLEVLRRGGRAGARLYGAQLDAGIAQFERARALAPNDSMIALEYAVALLQLDAETYAERAGELLVEACAQTPRDAFEVHAMRQGERIAAILERSGATAAAEASRSAFL